MRQIAWACVGLALGCSSPPSVVVHFDTDAPVPSAGGDPLSAPTPLFDALRIEVYPPSATAPCAGCINDFEVTADMFAQGTVSIGVPLDADGGYRLRARLYLRRLATADGPSSDATVDKLVMIPTSDSGMTDGLVFFDTGSAGAARDPVNDTPDPLAAFAGASSSVGSFPQAQRIGCDTSGSPQPPGAVCIPGGAYWMGTQDGQPLPYRSANWHRLAVMSPFYVDADEVTVARFRKAGLQPFVTNNQSGVAVSGVCTFTISAGPYEPFPVNCLAPTQAVQLCKSAGGAVPSGAQLEYVATQFGRSPYPWGFDAPTCAGVVWSRESTLLFPGLNRPNGLCYDPHGTTFVGAGNVNLGGPEAATVCTGSPCSFLDRVVLDASQSPAIEVRNLAGDLREFTSDRAFSESDTDCWGMQAGVITDPTCPSTSQGNFQVRAADWSDDEGISPRGDAVASVASNVTAPQFGFRCAYPATPLGM